MTAEIREAVQETVRAAGSMRTTGGEWDDKSLRAAFDALERSGWTGVGLDESLGGVGGDLVDAAAAASAAAYCAVPTPLPDVVMITNQLAQRLGVQLDGGGVVVAALPIGERALGVAWASWATELLVIDGSGLRRIRLESAAVRPGRNLAGLPSDEVRLAVPGVLDSSDSSSGAWAGDAAVRLTGQLGALARAVQLAAAAQRCLDLTVTYTQHRRQFGRALAELPVVQHELAGLAASAAAAVVAADTAVQAVAADNVTARGEKRIELGPVARRAIAVAKVSTGTAASAAARTAHQLHGAMGITREYELQAHTRAIWSWRDEYGGCRQWAGELGAAIQADPRPLWPALNELD